MGYELECEGGRWVSVGKHVWEKVTKCLEGEKRGINFRNRFACLLGVWCNDEETCGSRPMSSNPPLKAGGESHSLSPTHLIQ